ncbi:MAG TPA: DUF1287 domain-containing protein [Oceanospirillales bacterium]|nr:DUF1287 domain-containing protein [Oceanospirillales bacterium]
MIKLFFLLFFTQVSLANELVEAAKQRLEHFIVYDGSYQKIDYPNGDIDANKGVCSDVIIRSYRTLGVDLQKLVHEDMQKNFKAYPQIWGLNKPDSNIEHRRVPNLETFFKRHAKVLKITQNPSDYQAGDIVTWRLPKNLPHIGIVSDVPSNTAPKRLKIIHNIGLGPKLDDVLFNYKIVGHYRYDNK